MSYPGVGIGGIDFDEGNTQCLGLIDRDIVVDGVKHGIKQVPVYQNVDGGCGRERRNSTIICQHSDLRKYNVNGKVNLSF